KVTIPAGSSIAVHLWAINRNEAYWGPDAEEYNPGRWLNLDTLPEHPNAFASFSFGRRNCIDHTRMEFDCYTMLKVKSGHLMKFEMR
ncbi:Cytochrome P450 4d2, partial [Operophtera brumata]